MTIGTNLKRLRREAGLSQAKLASLSRVSQQLISQLENDTNSSTKELPALAKALGVSVGDIDESFAGDILRPELRHVTRENLEKLIAINKKLELFSMEDDEDGFGRALDKIDSFLDVSLPQSDHKK